MFGGISRGCGIASVLSDRSRPPPDHHKKAGWIATLTESPPRAITDPDPDSDTDPAHGVLMRGQTRGKSGLSIGSPCAGRGRKSGSPPRRLRPAVLDEYAMLLLPGLMPPADEMLTMWPPPHTERGSTEGQPWEGERNQARESDAADRRDGVAISVTPG